MSSLSPSATKSLEDLLNAYPSEGVPGTVVGVVNKEGKVLFLKAVGTSNIDTGAPMQQDQVFWIASCTKMVVGIAAMQLVEQGKLDLDSPVSRHIPELAEVNVISSSTATEIHTRKASAPITLRALLTHTAGFGYSFFNEDLSNWTRVHGNGQDEFTGEPLPQPLIAEPGQGFEYGINIDWAGTLIERVTGVKLGDYCEEHIFAPLGHKDATFDLPKRPDMLARLHTLHRRNLQTGKYFTDEHVVYARKSPVAQSGGAGMFTTVADYLGIVTVLLNEGRGANGAQILKPETVRHMFEDHTATTPQRRALDGEPIPAVTLSWTGADIYLLPGIAKGWGLTFMLNKEDIPEGRKAYSAEWYGICNCNWLADPTSEIGLVVFNNILPFVDPKAFGLMAELQKALYSPGNIIKA